jgi:hypothetical protein
VVGSCALALVLEACTIANTPQQDLAYARWAQCDAPFARLQRVDLDGRITFQFTNASERQTILQCLADADRTGPGCLSRWAFPSPGAPEGSAMTVELDTARAPLLTVDGVSVWHPPPSQHKRDVLGGAARRSRPPRAIAPAVRRNRNLATRSWP